MKINFRVLGDFTDKLAARDDIMFEGHIFTEYIKTTEKLIQQTDKTRAAYIAHVYETDRSETEEYLAAKKFNMDNDLRLQYYDERYERLYSFLDENKDLLDENKLRLLKINKKIEILLNQYPFLKQYITQL